MKTIIGREVKKLKKKKKNPTCLSTFLIHLYRNNDLLTPKEIAENDKLKSLEKYAEAKPEVSEDSEDVQEVSPTSKKSRPNPEVVQPERVNKLQPELHDPGWVFKKLGTGRLQMSRVWWRSRIPWHYQ